MAIARKIENWYGVRAAADYLGIAPNTLCRKIGTGGAAYKDDALYFPDGIRITTTQRGVPLWSQSRLDEIYEGLLTRQKALEE